MDAVRTDGPRAGLLELCAALASMQRCERIDDLLDTAAGLLRGAGVRALLAIVLRDAFSGSWTLEALAGGEPFGAFAPALLATMEPEPDAVRLRQLVQAAAGGTWPASGPNALVERVFLPELDEQVPRALLVALPEAGNDAEALLAVLHSAAPAVERILRSHLHDDAGFLLEQASFEERVTQEIGRARRYQRELSLLVCRPISANHVRLCGELLGARLRRWDAIGLLSSDCHELAAVLPETSRGGALGTLNRLREDLAGARAGIAVFPEDGRSQAQLIGVARMRSTRIVAAPAPEEIAAGTHWFRGAPAGLGPETVLCPSCLQPYSRAWRRQPDRTVSDLDLDSALDWLEATCPEHGGHIAVPAGGAEAGAFDAPPAGAPVMALLSRLVQQTGPFQRAAGLQSKDVRVA